MSSKTSILLTESNEHWYSDCLDYLENGKPSITLEFSKENVIIEHNDKDEIVLKIINPNCDLYKKLINKEL